MSIKESGILIRIGELKEQYLTMCGKTKLSDNAGMFRFKQITDTLNLNIRIYNEFWGEKSGNSLSFFSYNIPGNTCLPN